ncbi:hypothetical protein [Corynebacterium sp. LK26]|uniref:hypothetical protein n=1 Tax=Corynebacterium sp. LK26 TaxID=2044581 RepID=UPI001651ED97|nr:hypothetical protein [Corynebacterium sp. LK26]MBC6792663.1 hypothetical protein [Corynebacterium sp. LK26]
MTPEQARKLLEGTTPGPWNADDEGPLVGGIWSPDRIIFGSYFDWEDMPQWEQGEPEDRRLMAAAPDMAAMIANMTAEYAVQVRRSDGWQWSRDEDDFRWQPLTVQIVRADRDHPREETRIVCRYATTPQPLEGEEQ